MSAVNTVFNTPNLISEIARYLDTDDLFQFFGTNRTIRSLMYIYFERVTIRDYTIVRLDGEQFDDEQNEEQLMEEPTPHDLFPGHRRFLGQLRHVYFERADLFRYCSNLVSATMTTSAVYDVAEQLDGFGRQFRLDCGFLPNLRSLTILLPDRVDTYGSWRDQRIFTITNLPESLETLIIPEGYVDRIDYPPKLRTLAVITDEFVPVRLPESLRTLAVWNGATYAELAEMNEPTAGITIDAVKVPAFVEDILIFNDKCELTDPRSKYGNPRNFYPEYVD